MIINKFKKQQIEIIQKNQPDLFASIKAHFPDMSDEQKGRIAGFTIEYVLKSGGSPYVFDDKEEVEDDFQSVI